jgi:hypothetical protein
MTGISAGIEPGSLGALLDDDANGFTREAMVGHMAVAIDAPKDRTGLDLRMA